MCRATPVQRRAFETGIGEPQIDSQVFDGCCSATACWPDCEGLDGD